MDEIKAVALLIDAMVSAGMEYVVVGALASNHFGLTRSTQDADFLIRATPDQIGRPKASTEPPWRWEAQTAFDPMTDKTRHLLHLGKTFKAELFQLEQDAFDLSRMSRRLRRNAGGHQRFVLSPEDIVIQKLRWFKALRRPKDWDDTQHVMLAQKNQLDWEYIRAWCQRLKISEVLDEALASLPETPSL